MHALRSIAAGGAVFGTGVADLVLGHGSGHSAKPPFPQLTHREREILGLLAEG